MLQYVKSFLLAFKKSRFRQFTVLSIGNLLATIITAVSYPLISRLYSTSEFGEFAIFQSIFMILSPFTTLTFHEAIVLINSKYLLRQFLSGIFLICFSISFLIFIAYWFIPYAPTGYGWILSLSLFFAGCVRIGQYLFLKSESVSMMSFIKVLERSVFQGSAILIALTRLSYNGLIFATLISQVSAGLVTALRMAPKPSINPTLSHVVMTLKKYKSYPTLSLPGSTIETFSRQIPIFLFISFTSEAFTGQYAMAFKILSLAEIILASSLGQLFYVRITSLVNKKKPIKKLILRTWGVSILIGFFPFLSIALYGKGLFSIILGNNWESAGEIAGIIAPFMFVLFISTPTSYIINVLNKHQTDLYLALITLITRFSSLYYGLRFLSVYEALILFSLIEVIVLMAYNYVLYQYANVYERKNNLRN